MKKILLFISLIVAVAASAQLPPIPGTQPRSLPANRPQDYNLWVRNQLGLPIFNDTTQANTNTNLDTCGRVIYTYDVDNFWIRKCHPVKHWEVVGGGFVTVPTCGLQDGTGIVTYDDSTLNFDISTAIYALCCDHVPRTAPFTHVVLDSNTSDNPRIDAIILTAHGDSVIKGTPDPNPAQPQLSDCQILLTYVTINAHENIPANFSASPIIYDEVIIPPQWDTLSTGGMTVDFNDTTSPAHLVHDINISNITPSSFLTFTSDTTVNFGDYGVLKFYIKLKGTFSGTGEMIFLSLMNGNTPITLPLRISVGDYGFNNSFVGIYQIISIPISAFTFLSFVGDRLRIFFVQDNAAGVYMDWIQLQTGAVPSGSFVRSVNVGNLPPYFSATVFNPNTTPTIIFSQLNSDPFTVLLQDQNVPAPAHFGKIDLSNNSFFVNTLNVTSIGPGPDGTYLGTEGGTVQWLPKIVDTTVTHNGVYREVNGVNSTDSLSYGYWKRDSAALVYDNTYLGMNSKAFSYQQGSTDFWKIASNGFNAFITVGGARHELTTGINVTSANNLTLGNDGNVFTITGNTQINAITTANWQSGSQIQLIFSGTPTVKNNTAGGAGTARILLAGSVDFTAAANDVLSLVYDGFNWHESSRKTASGPAPGQQTLQQTFNTEVGGSVLTKNDTILTSNHTLNIIDNTTSNNILNISSTSVNGYVALNIDANSGSGQGIVATASLNAIQGSSSLSTGVVGQSGSGVGVQGTTNSSSNYGGDFENFGSTGSDVVPAINLVNQVPFPAVGANGVGVSIDFKVSTDALVQPSNKIISKWTTAADATRTSQFIITGVNSAATGNILVISGDGSTQMPKYGAGAATFDASGNITSVSDVRLKDVQGYYNGGLNELMNVNPIIYKWNEKSGMEMQHNYIGFSAQNIKSALGMDAIGINQQGYLSIQDRAILATLVNAIKEQQKEIDYLKSLINK